MSRDHKLCKKELLKKRNLIHKSTVLAAGPKTPLRSACSARSARYHSARPSRQHPSSQVPRLDLKAESAQLNWARAPLAVGWASDGRPSSSREQNPVAGSHPRNPSCHNFSLLSRLESGGAAGDLLPPRRPVRAAVRPPFLGLAMVEQPRAAILSSLPPVRSSSHSAHGDEHGVTATCGGRRKVRRRRGPPRRRALPPEGESAAVE